MGCFYFQDNKLFITEPESLGESILSIGNAIIEKHSFFWKLSSLRQSTPLEPEIHSVIHNQSYIEPYCNLCTDRLISISGGCKSCMFSPNKIFEDMNMQILIEKLKTFSYYEVDASIFAKEVQFIAEKSRNKNSL